MAWATMAASFVPITAPCIHAMQIRPFSLARLPRVVFGSGKLAMLPELIRAYGSRVMLVTGARSFDQAPYAASLMDAFSRHNLLVSRVIVAGEPSPELVDQTVQTHRKTEWDVVVGIGGGSALDAAKAIAGLLAPGNSVMDHLEGVGPELLYEGPAIPFIAVPTTAGTGSEATKNAVLSVQGEGGFKKSFRDEQLVAEVALVDPDLLATCPPDVIAANGMDALTQLLESYVSANAGPLTDSLAWGGMKATRDGLLALYRNPDDAPARERMAYAALISGITLAQVGLGSVHGLAAPLGAFFPIPHGVACGTLVAEATRLNLTALTERAPEHISLDKYAQVGRLLARDSSLDQTTAHERLCAILDDWTKALDLPRLSHYGVTRDDVPRIVANSRGSSMKTNPVLLTDAEIAGLVEARL